jgi:hypothetical protein
MGTEDVGRGLSVTFATPRKSELRVSVSLRDSVRNDSHLNSYNLVGQPFQCAILISFSSGR